ncbi:putative 1,2-phenylacetyl-CoA epoxidase, subunit D [Vibrio sp. MACH09]|uniref:1,2-phenylacetyl-CoA epoxidase subunit PaaD n=1 Tax=unclassified Vibrio TaxID=2614977 RepID=UPI0014934BAF|nr:MULTISPECIES: 1,2-phenylacetyl-CoA epoxidase subunit PaaD [unclassified Vibrio]NOI66756.1 phenylacetate-CoA oxygenase subunit PaaJ [Vibrio sp. 99-8-1]GLO61312.1 putative 1,2-phenylacetyl-CoA epoxidase, subunit D [Vibrio sp. MACH09]
MVNQIVDAFTDPQSYRVWQLVSAIPDPEIPVISIGELGMVRGVEKQGTKWLVKFTPTYSGCPATEILISDIRSTLAKEGFSQVAVEIQLDPAWTTDWMQESSKQKLREYGIAPPDRKACMQSAINPQPQCPHCGSDDSKMVSEFGSTACKAHYQCRECKEPFDYFKCI